MAEMRKYRTVIGAVDDTPRKRDPKLFKDGSGFVFEAYISHGGHLRVDGPLCTKSMQPLPASDEGSYPATVKCNNTVCQQSHKMEYDHQQYRERAYLFYEALERSQLPFETWDVSKSESSDSTHKVKAFFTTLHGKPRAIIYVFKKDENGVKTQIFLDLDKEQVTYDPGDILPGEIVSKITVIFKNSSQEITYEKID